MDQSPVVSVILPAYNGEAFVREAVESVLCQTYRNIELVVVDDGSTDGTRSILDSLAQSDSRMRVVGRLNGGVAKARNQGIAAARGELIAPIDADDVWEPTKIERQVDRMLKAGPETGLVYCWWIRIDLNGAILDRSPRWTIEGNAFETLLQVNYTGNASVPLFRRSCLEQVGGYHEGLAAAGAGGCEDWDVALKIAERYQVAVAQELLVGYRVRPGSMSSAAETMWRSQQLVMQSVRQLRRDIKPAVFRRSASQFALYLAGMSFFSGEYGRAIRWGLRATRSRVPFLILPYVLQMLLKRLWRRAPLASRMTPGAELDLSQIPEPQIPYNKFYKNGSR